MSSSGALRLNLAGSPCARCNHRRDDHVIDDRGVAHECMTCATCPMFVAGGLTEAEQRRDTDKEFRIDLDEAESKP